MDNRTQITELQDPNDTHFNPNHRRRLINIELITDSRRRYLPLNATSTQEMHKTVHLKLLQYINIHVADFIQQDFVLFVLNFSTN